MPQDVVSSAIDWLVASFDYLAVALLGGLVGLGELVARYRDEPFKAITTPPAAVYVLVNAAAAFAALGMIDTFGWFADNPSPSAANLTQVLVAGFGAMAVFRSSLFVVRVGNDDVGVGPVAFLQVILGASDRGVDRKRGVSRATRVATIMKGLSFKEASALPLIAMALLQNPDEEDAKVLGDRVNSLRDATMPDQLKVLSLALATMNVVGESVLEAAANAIRVEGEPVEGRSSNEGGGTETGAGAPTAPAEPTGAVGATAAGTALGATSLNEPEPAAADTSTPRRQRRRTPPG